jgi:uncharacterized repeat protein (TIGR01451 family)
MTNRIAIIAISPLIACCGAFLFSTPVQALTGGPAGTAPMAKPELAVTVSVDESTVNPGDSLTYTVVIKNTGSVATDSLKLKDVLPEGFSLSTTKASTYTYSFDGTLEPGQTVTDAYTVIVGDEVAAGAYADDITVSATPATSVSTQTTITVVIPQVKGAETTLTLAETGVGQLDVFFALFGATLVAAGILGLRYAQPA